MRGLGQRPKKETNMNDLEWKRILANRKSKRRYEGIIVLFLFSVFVASFVWYLFIYTKTPEYALKETYGAMKNGDFATFSRFVNLPTLTDNAYDDLTVDLFAYDSTLTDSTKVLFEKFYVLIKPELTRGANELIRRRIEEGEWIFPEGTHILKGRSLGIDFPGFMERSQIRNTEIVSLGKVEKRGLAAIAKVTVREKCTDEDFDLELVMEETPSGEWQIAYIKNYKDYLNRIAPLQNRDIASYIDSTKGIVDEYNEYFADFQARFKNLMWTYDGNLREEQREEIAALIIDEVIPALKRRQQKLDDIPIPPGAAYLSRLRQQSTENTIKTWHHFVKALRENSPAEFAAAESLKKKEIETDLRIEDIIKHTAISKNIPNVP